MDRGGFLSLFTWHFILFSLLQFNVDTHVTRGSGRGWTDFELKHMYLCRENHHFPSLVGGNLLEICIVTRNSWVDKLWAELERSGIKHWIQWGWADPLGHCEITIGYPVPRVRTRVHRGQTEKMNECYSCLHRVTASSLRCLSKGNDG